VDGVVIAVPPHSKVNVPPPPGKHTFGVGTHANRYAHTFVLVEKNDGVGQNIVRNGDRTLQAAVSGLMEAIVTPLDGSIACSAPPFTGTNKMSDCGPSDGL